MTKNYKRNEPIVKDDEINGKPIINIEQKRRIWQWCKTCGDMEIMEYYRTIGRVDVYLSDHQCIKDFKLKVFKIEKAVM